MMGYCACRSCTVLSCSVKRAQTPTPCVTMRLDKQAQTTCPAIIREEAQTERKHKRFLSLFQYPDICDRISVRGIKSNCLDIRSDLPRRLPLKTDGQKPTRQQLRETLSATRLHLARRLHHRIVQRIVQTDALRHPPRLLDD